MFYCTSCADYTGWPESGLKSYGKCEVCGRTRECNDVPSYALPKPKEMPYKARHVKEG